MQAIPFLKSIRGKMTLAISAIVGVLVALSVLATVQFNNVAKLVSVVSDGSEALMRISHVLDEQRSLIDAFQHGYGEDDNAAGRAKFTALGADLLDHAARTAQLMGSGAEHEAVSEAASTLKGALTRVATIDKLSADDREVAVIEIEESLSDAMQGFAAAKLVANKGMEQRLATVKTEIKKPVRLLWGAATIGVLVALAVSMFLRRRVSAPIADLSAAVGELSRGNAKPILIGTHDELGQLGRGFNQMAATIVERTRSLKLVLDNVGDGLITVDRDGVVVGEPSLRAQEWFGLPEAGARVWDYMMAHDPKLCGQFTLAFQQLSEDFMPFELNAFQMPRELARHGSVYALSYRQVIEDGEFRRVLIVVSDVTEQRTTALNEQKQRDVYSLASLALRDPDAFAEFCADVERRFTAAVAGQHVMLHLHTIKGNAGVVGCDFFAKHVHETETRVSEDGIDTGAVEALRQHWETLSEAVSHAVGRSAQEAIVVPRAEYDRLMRLMNAGNRHVDAEALAHSWSMHRVGNSLTHLAKTATRYAEREGKQLNVEIDGADLAVRRGVLDEFWGCLVHLVKNAVAHGIEPSEQRVNAGKPAQGNLGLGARIEGGHLFVVVKDDGAGIDWDKLKSRDLSGATGFALLSREGLSTAEQTTELAGRGVGVGAVAQVVNDLGGAVDVDSTLGQGTRFTVRLPIANEAYAPIPSLMPGPAANDQRRRVG